MRRRARTSRPRRARAAVTAAALALVLLAGACGTSTGTAPTAQFHGDTAPLPAGVTTVAPAAAAPSTQDCDVLASLRPSGPLPAPGAMPAGSSMRRIEQRGYLIAGVDQDSYLFGYRDPSAASGAAPVVGFDIDVVHEIAQAIFGDPDRVRFKIITQAQRISAVTSGQVDIVADSMTITCDRKQSVAFSTDYFDAGQRILVDENAPVQLVALLTHLLPKHTVEHVALIGWSGKKDVALLADAAGKGYDVFLTRDGRQLENPDETKAIMRAGIHHVRYTETVSGLVGVGLSMGAVSAAMPIVMTELSGADSQRLIRITRLDHSPRARFEMTDPRKRKPRYWRQ